MSQSGSAAQFGDLAAKSKGTQMTRAKAAAPTRYLVDQGHIRGNVLHHGEGKDVPSTELMGSVASSVTPYDPYGREEAKNPKALKRKYDTVVSNFVLNTLPPEHRSSAYGEIFGSVAPGGTAHISVRSDKDTGISPDWAPHQDGRVSTSGTFQKPYSEEDILNEIGQHAPEGSSISRHKIRNSSHSHTVSVTLPESNAGRKK